MKVIVNDVERDYCGSDDRSLLDYLRQDLHITSPKNGCSPEATCGCCSVQLDNKIVLACVTPMRKVRGGIITTVEGLSDYVRKVIADSFAVCGGSQCGFCIPGIVLRTVSIITKYPAPTRSQIEHELRFHLCRCTGYKKIIDSIQCAAKAMRDNKNIDVPDYDGSVGSRFPKYEIRSRVLGEFKYVADLSIDGMLHGAVKLSDHPRATVKNIHIADALEVPGVIGIFLAPDIPGERYNGLIVPDWPLLVAVGEDTKYIGDVIACVAANTREAARAAVKRIIIDYDILDPLKSIDEATLPNAVKIHKDGNCLSTTVIHRGNCNKEFAKCKYIVENTYTTQRIEHGYLEPEAALAIPTKKGVHIRTQSQGVYEDRRQIANILNLEQDDVRVELVPNGGGFGGKEDLSVQGHAALMAYLLQQPVHIELSREESIMMHPKRHPLRLKYKVGCDSDGKLCALCANIDGDTGAYASVGMKVLERAAGHATGAYYIPNVDITARAIYTNNIPCGAMRGFGANQANFAIECAIDELCELGGFDRWQFRYDNALTEGDCIATGQILASGIGVRATLDAVREDFQNAKYAGIASGIKNTGIGNGMTDAGVVKIKVLPGEHIELRHGWTEMGQGVDTMAIQVFCQETGLPPDIITVRVDSSHGAYCGMTTASRATSLIGNSMIDACDKLKKDLKHHTLDELIGRKYRGEWVCDWTTKVGSTEPDNEVTHYSYSYATQVVLLDDDGTIRRIIAAHDAGKVMNPTLFEGQIEGAIHMGLGYAISEDLSMTNGYLDSTKFRNCGILRASEMPTIEVIAVEVPDEHGPYGAKGVGEIGLVPTAPAVANAYYAYDGKRRYSLPMTGGVKS